MDELEFRAYRTLLLFLVLFLRVLCVPVSDFISVPGICLHWLLIVVLLQLTFLVLEIIVEWNIKVIYPHAWKLTLFSITHTAIFEHGN